jgi:hypothetical protein
MWTRDSFVVVWLVIMADVVTFAEKVVSSVERRGKDCEADRADESFCAGCGWESFIECFSSVEIRRVYDSVGSESHFSTSSLSRCACADWEFAVGHASSDAGTGVESDGKTSALT